MNQVALDWPLTVKEKTKRLVQLQEDAITELSSNPVVVQSMSDAIRHAKDGKTEGETEKEELQLPMTPPKERPETSTPDGTPTMHSVVKNLNRLSDRSNQSQDSNGALAVDPTLLQDALVALSKLCAIAGHPKRETDEEHELPERKSKSQPCRTSQPSALQKKRNSRGPNTPRVRFADLEDSGDDTRDADAKTRGRNPNPRRISRGPDGKTYAVPEPKPKKGLNGITNSAIATAAATAVADSVSGGFYGTTGTAVGAASGQRTRRVWRKRG